MIKEERKRKRKIKFAFKVFMGIVLFLIILFLVIWNVFKVEKVEVEGNELYDATMIQSVVLNDEYSWNSLYVFMKYKFMKPERVPFVDYMEISLKSPTTLHINVYEKGTMGYIYIPSIGENAYFDKDGFVVETSTNVIEEVPLVVGLDCSEVVLYEKLPVEKDLLREILSLTQALKKYNIIPDSVVYGVEGEPALIYGSVTVQMGDLTLQTPKVERLVEILPNLSEMSGTLHMEKWSEENADIVFSKSEQ